MTTSLFRPLAAIASAAATCQLKPVEDHENPSDPNWYWTISRSSEMDSSNGAILAVGCSPKKWQAIRVGVVNTMFENDKDDGRVRVQFKLDEREPEDIAGFYFDPCAPEIIERSANRSEFLRMAKRVATSSTLYVRAYNRHRDRIITKPKA